MIFIRLFAGLAYALLFCSCAVVPTREQKRQVAMSEPFAQAKPGTLFSEYVPLQVHISAPLTTLFSYKKLGRDRFKEFSQIGTMTVGNDKYPVRIQMKGFSTAIMCPFPKMEITILENRHLGTLFSEAKTFDLNTHCADQNTTLDKAFKASFYNHREALLYRVLEILRIPSYKARPAYVQYTDEDSGMDMAQNTYQAFFLEDMSSFKKRLNAREIKGANDPYKESETEKKSKKAEDYIFTDVKDSEHVDVEDASRIALFNEMIGNYDWFIKSDSTHMRSAQDFRNLWNVKIVELANGKWILFPQDFSLAETVTGIFKPSNYDRVFGLADEQSKRRIIKSFLEKKDEILRLGETLDPEGKKYFNTKIINFFKTIE